MQRSYKPADRRREDSRRRRFRPLLCGSIVLVLTAVALVVLPNYRFGSEAVGAQKKSAPKKASATVSTAKRSENGGSAATALENYDIRTDKRAIEKIAAFRRAANRSAVQVADLRDEFARGEAALRQKLPTLKVEYSQDLRAPEVIAPDAKQGRAFLARSAAGKRADLLRGFARENKPLLGVSDEQLNKLRVTTEYANPDGNLAFAHLEQFVGDVPVFRGEIKAGFTKSGELVRVVNNLAPGLDYESLPKNFGDPLDAVRVAARAINVDPATLDLTKNKTATDNLRTTFGRGEFAATTTAEKIYFPTEPGVAVAAWRVLIWQPVNAYYVIVDAETGVLLWRKNIVEEQTQTATYNVYANPNAMLGVADSPAPMTPGPASPDGAQAALINRTNVTLIGNEAPYSFNNNGWIADGNNATDGNAVEAGPDRVAPDGVDAPVAGGANRNFTFNYNPPPGNPAPGDDPLSAPSQQGGAVQMFYIVNRFHDEMYLLGFTEAARNFQHDNFGRGGAGGDRISAQSQDAFCAPVIPGQPQPSCANNANFATPADGGRGRMQMFLWTSPTPDRDGALDADIVIHELAHGLSNRLHFNATGLTTSMARGMGEGWSDFYALSLLSEPSDPINGVYPLSGYSVFRPSFPLNYYFGIRRFPLAVMAFTGGANNRPHNPLTFADIDATQINLNDGAFSPAFIGENADDVHRAGEVWSSALWEVRARYINRLGWPVGNRRILQHVTDGMKLSPANPTFLQARDAIIAAAQASLPAAQASADVADIWEGFRIRGMGFGAAVSNNGVGAGTARVIEAFDAPNLQQTPAITISDTASGDGDGFAEPGEIVTLNVPLRNNTGTNAENTTLQLVGGALADYGTIVNNSTVTRPFTYAVPGNAACGGTITLTFNANSSLGPTTFSRVIIIGVPNQTLTENFDGVAAPQFPSGWTATGAQGGIPFVNAAVNPDTPPNAAFAQNPSSVGGAGDLTSPAIQIAAAAAVVSFRHSYSTEADWDGGALEISIAGGAFQDVVAAGGSFIEGGYNSWLGANGANNPLAGRRAWTGDSAGYLTTKAILPAAAAGQSVRLRWRFGADDNTALVGWRVDTIQVVGSYGCALAPSGRARADFDGDGKTDLSVFRPSDTIWYLNRSTAGFTGVQFGIAEDILTPGDYDGDGKTDISVFRPSNGTWYRLNSSNGQFVAVQFGQSGDIPQAGDFDGDGKDDLAVWRPNGGNWFRLNSSNGAFVAAQFGQNGDKPVAGDYDGDRKDDLAVFRPEGGIWYRSNSSDGQFVTAQFGIAEDFPVPADYDGDNREDIAVWRPSNGVWYWLNSSNGQFAGVQFGQTGDVPAPGDYDGDGKDDQAVYRAGTWYLNQSSSGFAGAPFGLAGDRVVPKYYIP